MKRFLLLASALLLSGPAAWADTPEQNPILIEEWPVPWTQTRPRDPGLAPDGSVWFCGQAGHYLARFDPNTGQFERFDLDPSAGPHNLIVADDGMVWYAGNAGAHIGKLNPENGEITRFEMPDGVADPHTLVFDHQGHIWFSAQRSNVIGRLTMADGQIDIIDVPTQRARPYGILVDQSGQVWSVLLGTNKLAHIDPVTLELNEIELPRADTRPRRIGLTSDGSIWYSDYAKGYIGRYSPADQSIEEWKSPTKTEASGPYALTVDANDRIWFVETFAQPNIMMGFDPASESFFSATAIPSGGGTVRHMVFDPAHNAIWFGTDTNNLGKASLP